MKTGFGYGLILKKCLVGYKPITGFSDIAGHCYPIDGLPCLAANHFLQKNIEGGQGIEADSSTGAESP
jgi:hypothetical protein